VERVPVTPVGYKLLNVELNKLKNIDKPRIIAAISIARSYGDLKENSEYHTAVEAQLFLEKRIESIELKIQNAFIIDVTKFNNTGRIMFGATIVLEDLYSFKEIVYKIVGTDEANLKDRKISIGSPVAKSLINRYKYEVIHLKVPRGIVSYKVLDVIYI
jgi:transcription elongation factor GreA